MCLATAASLLGRYSWRVLALVIALYLLCGCLGRTQTEQGAIQGTVAGQPVAVKWTRDTSGETHIDLPPGIAQAVGNFLPEPWRTVIDSGLTLLAGGSLLHAHRSNKRAKNKDKPNA